MVVTAWFPLALLFADVFRASLIAPVLALLHSYFVGVLELWIQHSLDLLRVMIPLSSFSVSTLLLLRKPRWRLQPGRPDRSDAALLAPLVAGVFVLHYMPIQALGWDARFIWYTKARIFMLEPSATASALSGSAHEIHPGYPPAVPMLVSDIWRRTGTIDPHTLRLVVATLAVALLGLLLDSLQQTLPTSIRRKTSTRLILGGSAFLLISTAGGTGPIGYLDLILALALASVAIITLQSTTAREPQMIVLTLAAAAAITKQEGFVFLLVILIVSRALTRKRLSKALILAFCFYCSWSFTKVFLDVPESSAGRTVLPSIVDLAMGDSTTFTEVLGHLETRNLLTVGGFLIAHLFLLFETFRARKRSIQVSFQLLITSLLCFLLLLITYLFGAYRDRIVWWIDSSLTRISTVSVVLLVCQATLLILNVQSSPQASHARGAEVDSTNRSVALRSSGRRN